MRPIVTYEGIDEALKNLRYTNRNSLKSKLISTIRERYLSSGGSVDSVNEIDTDFLVKTLWETGDDSELIRSRRKNFNSIKSTVNADLKKLYSDGLNKEGIIINQKNIFDMSDEAKSEMLESFSYGGKGNSQIPLDKITDVLSVINEFISNKESGIEENAKFEQLKELIRDISGKVGISIVSQDGNANAVYTTKPGEISSLPDLLSGSDNNKKQDFIFQEKVSNEVDEGAEILEDEIREEPVDETDDKYEELELEDLPEEEMEESDKDEVDIIDEPLEEPVDEVDELEEVPEEELEEDSEEEIVEELLEGDTEEEAEDEVEDILNVDEGEELPSDLEDVPVDEIEAFPEDKIVEESLEGFEDDEFEEVEVEEASDDELEDEIELVEEPINEPADEVDELEEIPEEELEELPVEEEEPLDDDIEGVPEDETEDIPEEEIEEKANDEFEDDEYEEIEVEDVPEEIEEEELEALPADDSEDDFLEDVDDVPVDEADIEEAPEDDFEEEIELIDEPLEEATDEVDELEEVPEEELEEVPDDEIEDLPFNDEEKDEEEELPDDIEDIFADDMEDVPVDEVDIEDVPEELEDAFEDDAEIIEEPLGESLDEVDQVEDLPEEELEELPEDEIVEEPADEPIIEFDDLDEIPADELEEVPEDEIDDLLEEGNDYSLEEILNDYDTNGYLSEEGQEKALILADRFDKMLSDTERYYNRYLLVPGGRFLMVNASPKIERKSQNYIDIPDFYFGKFPVTNHLFELFIEKTGYVTTAERLGYSMVYKGRYRYEIDEKSGRKILEWNSSLNHEKVDGASWFQPNGPGSTLRGKKNHPVVQVTLEDAMAFAAWTGKRLPTEQEWEAAARTSSGLDYPWGRKADKERCNIEASAIGDTTPVDKFQKAANRYELYDLLGNVFEWTVSSESQEGNVTFIAKGGSWVSGENISLTSRVFLDPKSPSNIVGFRCIAYK